MSKKAVYNLLTRAFLDPSFRQRLQRDIQGKGISDDLGERLASEEIEEIRQALEEGGGAVTGLDQRLSKSGVSLSPQAMLRQKGGPARRYSPTVDYRTSENVPIKNSKVEEKIERETDIEAMTVDDYDSDEPDYEVERD